MRSFRKKIFLFWAHPKTGDILSALAGVAFLSVGILLPLVGRAGSAVPWAHRNACVFETVVLAALALALAAMSSKLLRRRSADVPAPRATTALVALLALVWLAFRAGWLAR